MVVSAQDYYPFGMEMPGRSYALGALYRFGFNGQERDREWNKTHFRFREYDERSGRMISVDPLGKKFSWITPYNYAENSPLAHVDLWGLQKVHFTYTFGVQAKQTVPKWIPFGHFFVDASLTIGNISRTFASYLLKYINN